jgi:dCTP diphosphatase
MTTDAPPPDPLLALRDALRVFARDRDWEPFHTPKNLAAALSVEASELLEPFQWLTDAQSASLPPETLEAVRMEMADVLLYLVRLADTLDVDLAQAARDKLLINAVKYPVETARGSSRKADRA